FGEEEPQPGDGGIDGRRADLLLGHVQLKAAKVLARRLIRRTAEELREGPHVPDVVLLNLLLEPPRGHVLDHALPQQADGIVGHRKLLSRIGLNPTILRQARVFLLSLPVHPLRALAAPTARAVYTSSH